MTPYQIILGAKQLLADPTKWTQGYGARDSDDKPCDTLSLKACQFCVIGALSAATATLQHTLSARLAMGLEPDEALEGDQTDGEVFMQVLSLIRQAIDPSDPLFGSIVAFNDAKHRTYDDVIQMLSRALSLCPPEN